MRPAANSESGRGRRHEVRCGWAHRPLGAALDVTPGAAHSYVLPEERGPGVVYLEGPWISQEGAFVTPADSPAVSAVVFPYEGTDVAAVLAPGQGGAAAVSVSRDSYPIAERIRGADLVAPGRSTVVEVTASRLYSLVADPRPGLHELRLETTAPGLQVLAITYRECADS